MENQGFTKSVGWAMVLLFTFLCVGILSTMHFQSCATTGVQKPSVCDTIPEGQTSVICDLSAQVGQPPETVAGILKIANIGALSGHLYTAQQAALFIDEAIGFLEIIQENNSELTYMVVVQYILQKLEIMPPEVQAIFVVLEDFMHYDFGGIRILSPFDIDLLLKHLHDQKAILAPFVVVK